MTKYSRAYSGLIPRLVEVEHLTRSAARLERLGAVANRPLIDAQCRGAIVLLNSHLEAFVKELGEVALDRFATRGSKNLGSNEIFSITFLRIKFQQFLIVKRFIG